MQFLSMIKIIVKYSNVKRLVILISWFGHISSNGKARLIAVSLDAQSLYLIIFCFCSFTGGLALISFELVTGSFDTCWSFASKKKSSLEIFEHTGFFRTIILKSFFDILVRGIFILIKVMCSMIFSNYLSQQNLCCLFRLSTSYIYSADQLLFKL